MTDEKETFVHYAEWRETVELALARDAAINDAPVMVLLVAMPDGRVASTETLLRADDLALAFQEFTQRYLLPAVAAPLDHLQNTPSPLKDS